MSDKIRFMYLVLVTVCVGLTIVSNGCIAVDVSSTDAQSGEELICYTEELPPYSYIENGTVKGFTVDLLEEMSARAGTNLSRDMIRVVPWEEGYEAALSGNNTVLFATARIPEREDKFKWVGPISRERYVLFAGQNSNISINSTDDLRDQRIGVIEGDASNRLLLDAGVDKAQLVKGNNVSGLITKLGAGEIDLWAYPEMTGRYYAGEETGDYYLFEVVYPLDDVGIYYAFSKDVPDSTIRKYQEILDTLKQEKDGTGKTPYDRILEAYIPSRP